MAKPRIFLSSTCYDLSTVRAELTRFLESRGFEAINSQDKNFGVSLGMHSHTACLSEVESADYLLLVIGSRRGGTYIGSESLITNEEYKVAEKLDIPRIVAVQRSVWDHRPTYKKNPRADHSHIVDDVRIFSFIDYIASGHSDNWVHTFETIQELEQVVTTQFAHYLTQFSKSIRKKEPKIVGQQRELVEFPTQLDEINSLYPDQDEATSFRNGLRALHELLKGIITDGTKNDAKAEKLKQIWVLGRYGECHDGDSLSLSADRFKQYAWSTSKGRRVNNQFEEYRIRAYYNDDPEDFRTVLDFKDANEETPIAWVLQEFIRHSIAKHNAEAFEIFCRADMRIYSS